MTADQALIILLIIKVIQLNNVYLYPAHTAEKLIRQKKCEPPRKRQKIYHSPRPVRGGVDDRQDFVNIDIFERTGIFEDQFEKLFQQIKNSILTPRSSKQRTKYTATPQQCLALDFAC